MKELAIQYKISKQLLAGRISELEKTRAFLIRRTKDPHAISIVEIEQRLQPLKIMMVELSEVSREVSLYYDRRHWRNETITLNQRKSRQFIYFGSTRF